MNLDATETIDTTTKGDVNVENDTTFNLDEIIADSSEYLVDDDTLLEHEYITQMRLVVTNADIYEMQIKQYNLSLLFVWLFIAVFVFQTIFSGLKHFYSKS